jgi:hypothetical protein
LPDTPASSGVSSSDEIRNKLFLILLTLAVLTNGVSMAVMYGLSERCLLDAFRSKVLSIAATAAAMLDGDLHRNVRTRADEASAAYRTLQGQLQRARDANRRHDTYVNYLVTMMSNPRDPGTPLFGVDPEENPRDASHVEDLYRSKRGRHVRLDAAEVDATVSEDQWGTRIGANVPVKDSAGNVVAAVSADVSLLAWRLAPRSFYRPGSIVRYRLSCRRWSESGGAI